MSVITHTFVSAKADGADATLVNPSNWNADHTINASLLLDLVSSTNGVLLTRTAGGWAPVGNVTTDNGDLAIAVNASPVAPSGGVKPFATNVSGRAMLATLGAVGMPTPLQPLFAQRSIGRWTPLGSVITVSNDGLPTATAQGTATVRAPATTSIAASLRRVGYVSAATAASTSGVRSTVGPFWRGNTAKAGGFFFVLRFMISDASLVTTANMFAGLQASLSAPTDVAPSTLVNQLGIGCDNGDTVLQLYAAGSAAQTRTSLGASFPVNTVTTDVYELALFCEPNGSTVRYQVTRLNTGDIASGTISAGANLPANTQLLTPQLWRGNGGTATAVGVDLISLYTETEI